MFEPWEMAWGSDETGSWSVKIASAVHLLGGTIEIYVYATSRWLPDDSEACGLFFTWGAQALRDGDDPEDLAECECESFDDGMRKAVAFVVERLRSLANEAERSAADLCDGAAAVVATAKAEIPDWAKPEDNWRVPEEN
jgi:hypothetical protein